ncbi:MAG: type II toxin-antitoxin system RelE/ParE family toxin [Parabacteroides sp.]|nr:type II toxin-antitoxin system RelE/ParE family toxin [Parabacteroides sp.]
MNYRIKYISAFAKELKRLGKKYRSIPQDYACLLVELQTHPEAGVSLGGGVRKVRMAIGSKNKGKSHGARVITFTYSVDEETGTIVLLYLYDKEERETVSPNEIMDLLAEMKREYDL